MKYALRYGGITGIVAISAVIANLAVHQANNEHSLWWGYLVMIAALSLIFIGVKRYRDFECGGGISFRHAFSLGVAMSLVAGIIYVTGWEIYSALSGHDFMADYSASVIQSMRVHGASQAEIQAKVVDMRALAERYRNPMFRLPMTFIEIFPVSLLVALISALVLRRSRALPNSGAAPAPTGGCRFFA